MSSFAVPDPSVARLEHGLSALAEFVDADAPGNTRLAFGDSDRAARAWIRKEMSKAGLRTSVDGCGNVIGALKGERSSGAIVTGSHVDTVYGGGRFDGTVGVVGGIEGARLLAESGARLDHELRVVCFMGEESNDHGISSVGSRAIAGRLDEGVLALTDRTGQSLASRMAAAGIEPSATLECHWTGHELLGFVELHVEQGRVLEDAAVPIGVVDRIVGIRRREIIFAGRADHAGTTPMSERLDASTAAAEAILAVEGIARDSDGHIVATAGSVDIRPGAMNVVPSEARMTLELRGTEEARLDSAVDELGRRLVAIAARRRVGITDRPLPPEPVQVLSSSVGGAIRASADRHDLPSMPVPSWATHDASHMAALCPTGMIFVPSVGGRSHCPEELTRIDDVAAGVKVLVSTILALDKGVPN